MTQRTVSIYTITSTFFIVILTFLTSGVLAQNVSDFQSLILPAEMTENANSILRDERIVIDIPSQEKLTYSNYRVVTVLNQKGLRHIDAFVGYDPVTKVEKLEATVYDRLGKKVKTFKKKDFEDVSAVSGGTLFTDSRVLYLNYKPIEYPFTLVFKSVTETKNTAFIPGWLPNGDYYASTEKSTVTINSNPELGLRYKLLNPNDQIEVEKEGGRLQLSAKNFKALVPEAHSPGFNNLMPRVLFSLDNFYLEEVAGKASDWETFGKWVNDYLLKGTNEINETTRQEILQLVSGDISKMSKARKVYEYVQNKTRYISVQVGIGGWKPMLASEVDALGYGDCKALTNYTKALLEVAGIPSYYTILYGDTDKRDIQSDFSSLQGNHAILAIPNEEDYIWLECTNQDIPFGFTGDFTDDRDVLVVTPEGGEIVHTKKYDEKDNTLIARSEVTILPSGGIKGVYHGVSRGMQYNDRYRLVNRSLEEKEEHYKDYWDYRNDIEIHSITLTNSKENISLSEKIKLSIDLYATIVGDEMLIETNIFNKFTYVPKRYSQRKYDLQLDTAFHDEDEIVFVIPDGYKIDYLPESVSLLSEFGAYEMTVVSESENKVKYKRNFDLLEGRYESGKYNDFRNFLKKVNKADSQKIVLTKI